MVQAEKQTVSQLRDQLEGQGFVEKTLLIGGAQYSIWMKGCADPSNPEVVSQFMQDNASNRGALRVYAIDRNTGDIGVTREGFAELGSTTRKRGLGETYGGAATEAREAYEREHPPATFREEAAAKEAPAPVAEAPVVQAPVVQPPAAAERVAAQISTPGTLFRIAYVPDPLGATQYADYYIDINKLSPDLRRELNAINEEYLRNGAYTSENELPSDVRRFIERVPESAWIRSGDVTEGTRLSFTSGVGLVTGGGTTTYQAAIDLNVLSADKMTEYNELLRLLQRSPANPGNLDMVNEFLNSVGRAVISRPTQA